MKIDNFYGKHSSGASFEKMDDDFFNKKNILITSKLIKKNLKKMSITNNDLKDKTIMNVGSGREALGLLSFKPKEIFHYDISHYNIIRFKKYIKTNNLNRIIKSRRLDLSKNSLPRKKFDFIYLHGIIQHVDHVDKAVKNLIIDGSYNAGIVITLAEESPIINQVKDLIKHFSNFQLVLDSKNMEDIYKYCNIAIGAPGLSYLERMASGVPSLLIAQNKTHESLIDMWVKLGCGFRAENSINSIEKNLKFLLFNDKLRKELIKIGENLVDGKGAKRIANEIINMVKQND